MPTCLGRPATLVRLDGDVQVRGTERADVIVTGPGDDVIDGGGGDDRICSGTGDDSVSGGAGADSIDSGAGDDFDEGGSGSDPIRAGSGADTVIGNRGNDRLLGEAGAGDFLDGGLGDDEVSGGPGESDQVIGNIGTDSVYGGPGDGDIVRGDQGTDLLDGGPGEHDVASFATAGGGDEFPQGVSVDLRSGKGGDGGDSLTEVEDVIGSPFSDNIDANDAPNNLYGGGGQDALRAHGPGDAAFGGGGSDICESLTVSNAVISEAFAGEESCGPEPPNPQPRFAVELAGGPSSTTLTAVPRRGEYVPGSGQLEPPPIPGFHVDAAFEAGAWLITETPLPISAGEGCVPVSPSQAQCPVAGKPDAISLDGGPGDDLIEIDPDVPSYAPALMRGEGGADTVIGGNGDDSLEGSVFRGLPLTDVVEGGGGDDAVANGGVLRGGQGSDLLIARVCAGEELDGGAGADSASFAREGSGYLLTATLGGDAALSGPPPVAGEAPCREPNGPPTHIDTSVERFEGSPTNDVLVGDSAANTLLGRGGDDRLLGGGGDDILVGGNGRDSLFGEAGFDRLYGIDGSADDSFRCGAEKGVASLDGSDPAPAHCRVHRQP